SPEQLHKDVVARLQWKHFLAVRFPEPDVKSYYEANKAYFDKVMVRASHILIKVPSSATPAERQAAKETLEALRSDLVAGKRDFAESAKKFSDCPSKDKGGDLGLFPYKFVVVEPFAKAAFAMKVSDISSVVTTEFGVHLIKVTERTAGESSKFEVQKGMVREVMAQDQELYNRILVEQRKTAKIEITLQ
ncbi:MAG: peptidyl-prolyl cis-trans isomerase, partial [Gemmataceae bacterium]|nr:peptidyl-prolyl cis-trans isomerase [Gemmataceae bacterium]